MKKRAFGHGGSCGDQEWGPGLWLGEARLQEFTCGAECAMSTARGRRGGRGGGEGVQEEEQGLHCVALGCVHRSLSTAGVSVKMQCCILVFFHLTLDHKPFPRCYTILICKCVDDTLYSVYIAIQLLVFSKYLVSNITNKDKTIFSNVFILRECRLSVFQFAHL